MHGLRGQGGDPGAGPSQLQAAPQQHCNAAGVPRLCQGKHPPTPRLTRCPIPSATVLSSLPRGPSALVSTVLWPPFEKPPNPNFAVPEQEQLFQTMLNNRFFKISRQEKPPFYSASCSSDPLCSSIQMLCVSASVAEEASLVALEALLVELARVRLHGFSEREVRNPGVGRD